MEYVFAAMLGWCGSVPAWWLKPQPQPWKPQPDPWRPELRPWIGAVGALGGVIAAAAFRPLIADGGVVSLAITAYLGGAVLGSVGMGVGRR